jgi:hypothetical protein
MRGDDWALPDATANSTGITRPIQITCLRDQLIVLPDRNDARPPSVVPAPGPLVDVIDELVSAIWQHMDYWGLAVAGGYWKPILHVEVGHGADARYAELQALLQNSGMEVTRKSR